MGGVGRAGWVSFRYYADNIAICGYFSAYYTDRSDCVNLPAGMAAPRRRQIATLRSSAGR